MDLAQLKEREHPHHITKGENGRMQITSQRRPWLSLGLSLAFAMAGTAGAREISVHQSSSSSARSSPDLIPQSHVSMSNAPNALSVTPTRRRQVVDAQYRSVLIIRMVNQAEDPRTEAEMNNKLFEIVFDGTPEQPASVRHQLNLCSGGRVILEPASYGILSVTVGLPPGLDRNIEAWKDAAATAAMQTHFADRLTGAPFLEQLRGLADHVILILPPSFPNDDFVANAEISSSISIFTIVWSESLSSYMHELGHNLMLRHAGLNNGEIYGDTSGYMGFSVPQMYTPQKCYVASQHWELGWYENARFSLVESPPSFPMRLQVAAFVDHAKIGTDMVVLVQLQDNLFLQFNRQKDYNSGTDMFIDQIVVVSRLEDATRVVAAMDPEQTPVIQIASGLDMRVCEIIIQDDPSLIDYAVLAFGADDGTGSLCSAGGNVVQQQQQPAPIPLPPPQQIPPTPPPQQMLAPPLPQPEPDGPVVVQGDPSGTNEESDVVLSLPAPIPVTIPTAPPPMPQPTPQPIVIPMPPPPTPQPIVLRTFAPITSPPVTRPPVPVVVQTSPPVIQPPVPMLVQTFKPTTLSPTLMEQITWEPSTSSPTAGVRPLEPDDVANAGWPTAAVPAPTLDPWGVFSESTAVDGSTVREHYTPATRTSGFTSPLAIGGYIVLGALCVALAMVLQWRFHPKKRGSKALSDQDHNLLSQPWTPLSAFPTDLNDAEVDSNNCRTKQNVRNSTSTARTHADLNDDDEGDDMWPGLSDWSIPFSFNFWGSEEPATNQK